MRALNLLLLACATLVAGQFNCTQANTAFCESPVSGVTVNNIIFRCYYDTGTATPGNCNDDLADVPPVGLKYASCWESSPTAGDAQCTYNCVSVTAANGTTFYPVGCNRTASTTTSYSVLSTTLPSSSSLRSFGPSASETSSATSAATPHSTSNAAASVNGASTWQFFAMAVGILTL